jgi:hypothetical protein
MVGMTRGAPGRMDGKPCFAQYIPPEQAKLIVKKYMRGHPEWLGYDAGMVASVALITAFQGCQPNK